MNLGHSYLRSTSVENSEDESEEEEEEENDQPVPGARFAAERVRDNVEDEEMQVQGEDELRLVENDERLEFDDECNEVNVRQKSYFNGKKQRINNKKSKHKKSDGGNVQKCINSKVPDKFSDTQQKTETGSEKHEETPKELKNVETQVSLEREQELGEITAKHIEENQQTEEEFIELKLDIEVDPDFDQELNENEPDEHNCNNRSSKEILLQLNIDVLEDSVAQQISDLTHENQQNVVENKVTGSVAENREPMEDTERNQTRRNENIEVQSDNEVEQEFNDNDTLAKLQCELVSLEPKLNAQRRKTNKNVEKIKEDIQLKIDKLATELLNSNRNVVNTSKARRTIEQSIEQIQQEIEILKMESDDFDFNQDEELEKEIIEKLNKICSNSNLVNFFENLVSSFDQDSLAIRDKIKSLSEKYFQEFDNSSLTDSVEIANVEMIQKINRLLKQDDEEVNQKLTNETQNSLDTNVVQVFNKDILSECCSQNQKESHLSIDKINNVENKEKSQEKILEVPQKTYEVMPEEDLLKNFDMVITYNSNIQEMDNETGQDISGKVKIQLNEELLKKLQEDALKNPPQPNEGDIQSECMINNFTNNTIQQYVDKQVMQINCEQECNEENVQIELHEDDTQLEVDEQIKLDLSEKMEIDNNEQLQQCWDKEINEKSNQDEPLHLEIDFFRKTLDQGGSQGSPIQTETLIELFKRELLNDSRKISQELVENTDNSKEELHNESDVCSEKSKETLKLLNPSTDECESKAQESFVGDSQEESDVDVDEFDEESYKHFVEKFKELKDKCKFNNSESDIDIEGLEDESQSNLRTETQREPEKLETANLNNSDEPLLKINNAKFEKSKEINEVIELVEDYEIEPDISENNRTNTDPECSSEKKYPEEYSYSTESSSSEESLLDLNPFAVEYSSSESSLVDKFNSTYIEISSEEEKLSSTEELLSSYKDEFNSTEEICSTSDSDKINDENIQNLYIDDEKVHSSKESLKEVENEQQKFEPEDYSHKQFKKYQKDFYKDLKREYDKELQLKVINKSNPEVSQEFDRQQQTFYEIKDDFHELKQQYKGYMQKKIFKQLERDVDSNKSLEVNNFPEQYDDIGNVIDEDIHEEFAELQRECSLLEPEFKYNVPLDFEEKSIGPSLKPKRFDLFNKLYSIHRRKLCQFVDSKSWPENVSKN